VFDDVEHEIIESAAAPNACRQQDAVSAGEILVKQQPTRESSCQQKQPAFHQDQTFAFEVGHGTNLSLSERPAMDIIRVGG
jgi:hypothetical protein